MTQRRISTTNPQASSPKLSERDVLRIKQLIGEGYSNRIIAQHFLLATETVRRIARGDTWNWLRSEADLSQGPEPLPAGKPIAAPPPDENSAAEASLTELLTQLHKGEQE